MNSLDENWEYLELKQKNLWLDEIDKRYYKQTKILQPIWENLKIEWEDIKFNIEQEIENLFSKTEEKNLSEVSKLILENEDILKFYTEQEIDNLQSKISRQIEDFKTKIKPQEEYWNSKTKEIKLRDERDKWFLLYCKKFFNYFFIISSSNDYPFESINDFRLIWSSLVLITLIRGFGDLLNNIFKDNETLHMLTTLNSAFFFFCLTKIISPTYKSCFMIEAIMVILLSTIRLKKQTW